MHHLSWARKKGRNQPFNGHICICKCLWEGRVAFEATEQHGQRPGARGTDSGPLKDLHKSIGDIELQLEYWVAWICFIRLFARSSIYCVTLAITYIISFWCSVPTFIVSVGHPVLYAILITTRLTDPHTHLPSGTLFVSRRPQSLMGPPRPPWICFLMQATC